MDRKPIFDAIRKILGRGFTQAEVGALDRAIDLGDGAAAERHGLGQAGTAIIKKWEGCARALQDGTFAAYADPGSADGHPWTIGWGSTGMDVKKGTIWTQAQCDARFDLDVQRYVREVATFLDDAPTTPNQFDSLVSFHYNTGAIRTSTLGKLHKERRFTAAEAEFARWIYNDGKPMNGLRWRRAEEAKLYRTG